MIQDQLLLSNWPEGTLPLWALDKTSGLDCLTVIIRLINSHLTLEERSATHPVRQLEEHNQLLRHAWLDFCPGEKEKHVRAKVSVFEALSLRNGPSFKELVSSESLNSTIWARWDHNFNFFPIASELVSGSHRTARSAYFSITRSNTSASLDLGALIDQDVDKGTPTDSLCYNNPDFLRLYYTPADGDEAGLEELQTMSIRDRRSITQHFGDPVSHGRVRYVLRAAVRLVRNTGASCDCIQVFSNSGENSYPGS
ncbi:hypothetical protein CORC01_07292 [Colletotrichum orchidophilum]|uniref:Uncharacterized protein n=1 Tax=Colletotrichum orchidophilum TaxID=1209926 RepID=A0A1G4B7J3_9PEZI|nr:uncharacterized protein CORC01_07292 [Colletotrichum orchidophilum]OHE97387.1 hypothetical protein CORC01_07292 [Colletotrichum orchidophilum]